MFLFLKKMKRAPLAGLALALLAGVLFVSCPDVTNSDPDPTDAATPTISVQPQGGTFDVEEEETFELTVAANVTDSGTLSYQWYSNSSNSNTGGSAITAEGTGAALTLDKDDYDDNVTLYYYVVVTNTITDNGDGGKKTASITSAVAEVIIDGVGGVYLNAKVPVIDTQPTGGNWNVGTTSNFALTISANVGDGGTLSYQWYSNATNSASNGTAIGTASATSGLTLAKADYAIDDDYYFYVVVTNTNNDVDGNKTASRTSHVAAVTVTGNPFPDFILPEDLKGTWTSTWGEEFIITDTTFTSGDGGDVTYEGTIVNHRTDGSGAGYITIQYTTATYYDNGVGKFYVIHYKTLTATTMSIAGAYDSNEPEFTDGSGGKSTYLKAEAAYTVANGCFGGYSDCTKDAGGDTEFVLDEKWLGFWYDGPSGYGDGFTITRDFIGYDGSGELTSADPSALSFGWVGEIIGVKYFSTNPEEGFFVVKYFGVNYWTTVGEGDYTCFYFKHTKTDTNGDWYLMLNLAVSAPGGGYGQPMFEKPEDVITTCTPEYFEPQLLVPVQYCKAP